MCFAMGEGTMTTAVRRPGAPALQRADEDALRRQFDRDAIWHRMVKPGDRLPSMPLLEADLGPIHLDRLRLTGPIVLVFFRYASSEPCNAALAAYQERL